MRYLFASLLLIASCLIAQAQIGISSDTSAKARAQIVPGQREFRLRPGVGDTYKLYVLTSGGKFDLKLDSLATPQVMTKFGQMRQESNTLYRAKNTAITYPELTLKPNSFPSTIGQVPGLSDSLGAKASIALVQALTGADADTTLVNLKLIGKQNVRGDLLLAKDYNVVGNGVVNDVNSLTALLATSYAKSGKSTIQLSGAGVYKLNQGIVITQARLAQIIWSGAIIDCSSLTAGACITVTGAGSGSPYSQATNSFDKVEIIGPGKSFTAVKGLVLSTPNEGGTSHLTYNNVSIHGFGVGIEIGTHAYLPWFENCNVWSNAVGVRVLFAENNGEGIHFKGAIFNNDLGIDQQNGQSGFYLHGSLDYNTQQVKITSGRVFVDMAHFEYTADAGYPYWVAGNGSILNIGKMWMVSQTGTAMPPAYFHILTPYDRGGGVFIDHMSYNNCSTTSGRLADGGGHIHVNSSSSYETWTNAPLIADSENMLLDGGFESSTSTAIQDAVYVMGDQPNTDRYNARNSNLDISTATVKSGTKALRHYKLFGGGSASSYQLLIPIQPGKYTSFEMLGNKPGTSTGSLTYTAYFAGGVTFDASGKPTIAKVRQLGTQSLPLTSSASGWVKINCDTPPLRADSWAGWYLVVVNAAGWVSGGESMFYDEIFLNQF